MFSSDFQLLAIPQGFFKVHPHIGPADTLGWNHSRRAAQCCFGRKQYLKPEINISVLVEFWIFIPGFSLNQVWKLIALWGSMLPNPSKGKDAKERRENKSSETGNISGLIPEEKNICHSLQVQCTQCTHTHTHTLLFRHHPSPVQQPVVSGGRQQRVFPRMEGRPFRVPFLLGWLKAAWHHQPMSKPVHRPGQQSQDWRKQVLCFWKTQSLLKLNLIPYETIFIVKYVQICQEEQILCIPTIHKQPHLLSSCITMLF